MTSRMIFKFVFVLVMLLFMVQMGMSNKDAIAEFRLDLIGVKTSTQAAMMYFIFFGAGLVTGGVLALHTGKSGGSKKSKDS